jgi:ABC-2 type transport system ATP-binding protein
VRERALLEAEGISKRFGANRVLDNAGFGVREREVLGLIGPNGAGKTTLFECLSGLLPADAGAVRFRGAPLDAGRRKEALFYLPDGIRPWPDQPVRWALSFFESLYARQKGAGAELASALQLEGLLRSRIGSLSKGESKRTLLALALLTPHPLLLLDEPFDGLDFRQTREVMMLLRRVPEQGRTLFLSIHQLTDAGRVCDRLVLLSRGRVAGEGTLPELQAKAGLKEGGLEEVFLALT